MIEATYIKPEDLANLEVDENGNYMIPEGIKILIDEPTEVKLQKLYDELNALVLTEPTDEELIELGRELHPYYEDIHKKEEILKQIEELEV